VDRLEALVDFVQFGQQSSERLERDGFRRTGPLSEDGARVLCKSLLSLLGSHVPQNMV